MAMANNRLVDRQTLGVAEAQLARVAAQGSAGHAYLGQLVEGSARTPHATSPTRSICSATSTAAIPACSTWRLSLSASGPANDWLRKPPTGSSASGSTSSA